MQTHTTLQELHTYGTMRLFRRHAQGACVCYGADCAHRAYPHTHHIGMIDTGGHRSLYKGLLLVLACRVVCHADVYACFKGHGLQSNGHATPHSAVHSAPAALAKHTFNLDLRRMQGSLTQPYFLGKGCGADIGSDQGQTGPDTSTAGLDTSSYKAPSVHHWVELTAEHAWSVQHSP